MKQTILLADDSPTIHRLVEQTFHDGDYDVVSVSNGDAAIRKFEEIRPSAVLADVFMPGKNGYEVCAFVKQHPALGQTPVILLVGAFEAFDDDEARRVEASGKVAKPFAPGELLDLVSVLVGPAVSDDPVEEQRSGEPARSEPELAQNAEDRPDEDPERDEEPDSDENEDVDADLLGLRQLFPVIRPKPIRPALSEDELEAIADRVIERLSSEVIEGIAWEIVPDVAEKVVREEMKKNG